MSKNVVNEILLKLPAGKALPNYQVAPYFGQTGVNINDFCRKFNELTINEEGEVEIAVLVYSDSSFDILTKEQYREYRSTITSTILSNLQKSGSPFKQYYPNNGSKEEQSSTHKM